MKMFKFALITILLYSCAGGKIQKKDFNEEDFYKGFELEKSTADRFQQLKSIVETDSKDDSSPTVNPTAPVSEKTDEVKVENDPSTSQPEKSKPTKSTKKSSKSKKVKNDKDDEADIFEQKEGADYPDHLAKLDKYSLKTWQLFKPNYRVGEMLKFDVSYLGITAGYAQLMVKAKTTFENKELVHFYAKLNSAPFYKMIYSVQDYLESFSSSDNLFPVKYLFVQRESKKNSEDIQLYDWNTGKVYFRYRQDKDGVERKIAEDKLMPKRVVDAFASIYFIRGLPFKTGAKYQFPVMLRGKITEVKLEIGKKVKIKTFEGEKTAYEVIGHNYSPTEGNKLKGKAKFWFEDNEEKTFLKFEVELKFGTITGELSEKK